MRKTAELAVGRLIAFAEDRLPLSRVLRLGPLYDERGVPRLMVESIDLRPGWTEEGVRADADRLLSLAARSSSLAEAMLNRQRLGAVVFSQPLRTAGRTTRPERTGPSVLVPACSHGGQMPAAVLVMALLTETGSGDRVLDRVTRCGACDRLFLSKYRRPPLYCGAACRRQK